MDPLGARLGLHRGIVLALAWSVLTFLVLPLLVVVPVSVTDTRYLAMPDKGLSFQHFAKLASSPAWLGSIWNSVVIAVITTVLCVVLGTLCAVGCWRLSSRLSETVRTLMLLPIVVPSIVYSLGVYRLFVDLRLLDTILGVVQARDNRSPRVHVEPTSKASECDSCRTPHAPLWILQPAHNRWQHVQIGAVANRSQRLHRPTPHFLIPIT